MSFDIAGQSTGRSIRRLNVLCAVALAVGSLELSPWVYAGSDIAPAATPPGIVIVDVYQDSVSNIPRWLWASLASEDGAKLYTYDAERPFKDVMCKGACTKDFVPLLVVAHAKPFGDWSIVRRPEGGQWAYQGRPLYAHPAPVVVANDNADEHATVGNSGIFTDAERFDPGSKLYRPADGWRRAAFDPARDRPMPADISAKSIAGAGGSGLVNWEGRTLYTLDGSPSNAADPKWQPVMAATLARAVGEFKPIPIPQTGDEQWTYRGRRLYTFAEDRVPGDARGEGVSRQMRIALLSRDFIPATVEIRDVTGVGPVLATLQGYALYSRTRNSPQYNGRSVRGGFYRSYEWGKALGTQGCNAACLQEWMPLRAERGSRSQGYWEVETRADGTKQWAYKGNALYIHLSDAPNVIKGNNMLDIVYGDQGAYSMEVTGGDKNIEYGAGLYWHYASP